MIVITTVDDLRQQVAAWSKLNSRISFVPTMGNLHEGHLSLVRTAREAGDVVVVSIFVNPLQFGANEDFTIYPRTPEQDKQLLEAEGVDVLFLPDPDQIYKDKQQRQTFITVPLLGEVLEGVYRPGHFAGVATVVNILLNQVQPDIAVFGKKDYQQLLVIRKMVSDLAMKVEIIGKETVRESDGLAMSSRNQYLSAAERALAPVIYKTLRDMSAQLQNGDVTDEQLEQTRAQGRRVLQDSGFILDYLEICRQEDLAIASSGDNALVLLVAAKLGKTRLIDNLEVDTGRSE